MLKAGRTSVTDEKEKQNVLYSKNTAHRPFDYPSRMSTRQTQPVGELGYQPTVAPVTPDCPGSEISTQPLSLAMAYVPYQSFGTVNEPEQALRAGSLFPALEKPFFGQRRRT